MGLQHILQPLTLFFRRNLARHTGVVDRRHVNNEPARQRDMRSDARALLPQRFLGDLHDNFLAFLQQVGDGRQRGAFAFRAPGVPSGPGLPAGAVPDALRAER